MSHLRSGQQDQRPGRRWHNLSHHLDTLHLPRGVQSRCRWHVSLVLCFPSSLSLSPFSSLSYLSLARAHFLSLSLSISLLHILCVYVCESWDRIQIEFFKIPISQISCMSSLVHVMFGSEKFGGRQEPHGYPSRYRDVGQGGCYRAQFYGIQGMSPPATTKIAYAHIHSLANTHHRTRTLPLPQSHTHVHYLTWRFSFALSSFLSRIPFLPLSHALSISRSSLPQIFVLFFLSVDFSGRWRAASALCR